MKNFIICLSKIKSSFDSALKVQKQLENFNVFAELFEGTYGDAALKQKEKENRIIHHIGIHGTYPSEKSVVKYNRPGVIGCFYSHFNLWKKCVEMNEPIIIWEDDIEIQRPFSPVSWQDVLILGLSHPAKAKEVIHLLNNPAKDAKALPYNRRSMPGTCGYAIKPDAAKKLCNEYKNTYLASDNAINDRIVRISIHNQLMGISLDGNKSLTRTKKW